jgi:hypothetical protein
VVVVVCVACSGDFVPVLDWDLHTSARLLRRVERDGLGTTAEIVTAAFHHRQWASLHTRVKVKGINSDTPQPKVERHTHLLLDNAFHACCLPAKTPN